MTASRVRIPPVVSDVFCPRWVALGPSVPLPPIS